MNTLVDDAKQHGTAVGLPVDRITINGGKPLRGRIELKGAKNEEIEGALEELYPVNRLRASHSGRQSTIYDVLLPPRVYRDAK